MDFIDHRAKHLLRDFIKQHNKSFQISIFLELYVIFWIFTMYIKCCKWNHHGLFYMIPWLIWDFFGLFFACLEFKFSCPDISRYSECITFIWMKLLNISSTFFSLLPKFAMLFIWNLCFHVCLQSLQAPDLPFYMIFTPMLYVYGPTIHERIPSMNLIPSCCNQKYFSVVQID